MYSLSLRSANKIFLQNLKMSAIRLITANKINSCLMSALTLLCIAGYSIATAQIPNNLRENSVNPSMLYKGLNSPSSQAPDLESSASGYGGYSGGMGGNHKGSLIGGFLGDITGNVLRQILRSLTGIGIRLGVNLKNEFYNAPEYGYGQNGGGYGHGGYSKDNNNYYANGYSNMQETVANAYDKNKQMFPQF